MVPQAIVGRYDLKDIDVTHDELEGACKTATHVVSGMTAGAFTFFAGGSATVGGGISIFDIGGGGESSSQQEILNKDGDPKSCQEATTSDETPPEGCGALLRVEVVKISGQRMAGGSGTVGVRPNRNAKPNEVFVHIDSNVSDLALWNLTGDDTVQCTAPCDGFIDGQDGAREFRLKAQGHWVGPPFRLPKEPPEQNMNVEMVEEPSSGMRGGGIALVVVGSVMTAVGLFGGIISFVAIEGDSSAIVGGALLGGGIGLGVTGIVTGSLMIKGAKADYNLDIPGHQERAAALPRSSHPALTLTW